MGSFIARLPVHLEDSDDLYRWVHKEHHENGALKPGAFIMKKKDTDGLSIAIAKLTSRQDFHNRAAAQYTASVVLKVKVPREKGLLVVHDGVGHSSHGTITGFQVGFSNKQLTDMERYFIMACVGTLEEIAHSL